MLEASWPNGRKVIAIIFDEPLGPDPGVSGAVECCRCDFKAVLTTSGDDIADEIEKWALEHTCLKEQLLEEMVRQRLKKKGF